MVKSQGISKIIVTSSLGTLIEWYDFYIFGMLAKTLSSQFFPKDNPTTALLSTLAIFAAGFLVRPFGALVFGRLGDMIGRKSTFLLTLVLMGGSTFLIGLVPSYKSIGIAAPLLVLLLRLVQGLALGGEYGGAATYVAECTPPNRRGYYTSWIQTTATLGLFISLGVIMLVKSSMSKEAFEADWGGWRYPFWISILLVLVSIYIRLKMSESPLFSKLKSEGKTSSNPLKESFGRKANFKLVLLSLFGAVMGEGVVWYTGQFYAQSFMENTAKMEFMQSREIMLWAIAFGTPFFLFFGALSDRIGRKWIMMAGMLLAVVSYRPIFQSIYHNTEVDEVTLNDLHTHMLSSKQIKNDTILDQHSIITATDISWQLPNGMTFTESRYNDTLVKFDNVEHSSMLPYVKNFKDRAKLFHDKKVNDRTKWYFIFLVWSMIVMVTMVYGPIAAFLVELFPTSIRYTSMSLPYHIGNGIFGGLVPFIAMLLTVTFKDPLVGLWYPIGISALCLLIGIVFLNNRIPKDVNE